MIWVLRDTAKLKVKNILESALSVFHWFRKLLINKRSRKTTYRTCPISNTPTPESTVRTLAPAACALPLRASSESTSSWSAEDVSESRLSRLASRSWDEHNVTYTQKWRKVTRRSAREWVLIDYPRPRKRTIEHLVFLGPTRDSQVLHPLLKILAAAALAVLSWPFRVLFSRGEE